MSKRCMYCNEELTKYNVYKFNTRKEFIDKCDRCTDKLEQGADMYEQMPEMWKGNECHNHEHV